MLLDAEALKPSLSAGIRRVGIYHLRWVHAEQSRPLCSDDAADIVRAELSVDVWVKLSQTQVQACSYPVPTQPSLKQFNQWAYRVNMSDPRKLSRALGCTRTIPPVVLSSNEPDEENLP